MLAALERSRGDPDDAGHRAGRRSRPAPTVASGSCERARTAGKPVVVCLLGGDPAVERRRRGDAGARTLDDAAALAVTLAGRRPDRRPTLASRQTARSPTAGLAGRGSWRQASGRPRALQRAARCA